MNSFWFWLSWILPELTVVLLVVWTPSLYRNFGKLRGRLKEELRSLSLETASKEKEALGLVTYQQDLNLAAVSIVILGFTIVKFGSTQLYSGSGWPVWTTPVIAIYCICSLIWLDRLRDNTEAKPYAYVNDDNYGVHPIPGLKPKGKIRVAGKWGRAVWWTRLLCAFSSLVLGVFSGIAISGS